MIEGDRVYKISGYFLEGERTTQFEGFIDLSGKGPLKGGRLIDANGMQSWVVEPLRLNPMLDRYELEFSKDYENRNIVNGRILYVYRLKRRPTLSGDGTYYRPRGGSTGITSCTLIPFQGSPEELTAAWEELRQNHKKPWD